MVKKAIKQTVKLTVAAGKANPAPPIGPVLGANGINIPEFCKRFNDASREMEEGMPIPTIITLYEDRSFSFILKTPPVSYLLRKELKLEKGSSEPNKHKVGRISREGLKKIASLKLSDSNSDDVEALANSIAGTARSMGIEVTE